MRHPTRFSVREDLVVALILGIDPRHQWRNRAHRRERPSPRDRGHANAPDKSNMSRYLFGGFSRCLYPTQKFQSDAERKLAVILERESLKWFKPARGQFQLFYRSGTEDLEYQPDFVAETETRIFMMEPKAANQMADPDVLAKRDTAVEWCRHASEHAASYQGQAWTYVLIPHDAIAENMTLEGLAKQFSVRGIGSEHRQKASRTK